MEGQHLSNLLFHRVQGVEGAQGLLKDHPRAAAPDAAQHFCVCAQDLLTVKAYRARDRRTGGQEAQRGQSDRGLARPAFPHQGEGLPLVQVKGHVPDGLYRPKGHGQSAQG